MAEKAIKSVMITGGTGPLGRAIVERLLKNDEYSRIVVYSHSENAQADMKNDLFDDRIRYFLGDVRDISRLRRALNGIDAVFHLASLNNFESAEYDPFEFIETNINGTKNLIEACIQSGVTKVIAVSTDKAVSPSSLYGATRLVSEKIVIAANHYAPSGSTKLSVVRLGNLIGGNNSIIDKFRRDGSLGLHLTITDKKSSRFWMTVKDAADFICACKDFMSGGEIFIPKIPSLETLDLAQVISPSSDVVESGLRNGEKLHEYLYSTEESRNTIERTNMFVVLPYSAQWGFSEPSGSYVAADLPYSSETNTLRLSSENLRRLIFGYDE